jgi:hypothetical protein
MGRPFVKRYREERELAMVLAVDVSASSAFGSLRHTKRQFAAEIAGTLAISAARSSDKVALLLFTDQVELFCRRAAATPHSAAHPRMLFDRSTAAPTSGGPFLNVCRRSIVFPYGFSAQLWHLRSTCAGRGTVEKSASQRPPRRGMCA